METKHNDEWLGYIKYEGESVRDGFLDMRKSADALSGFDKAIRYFLSVQDPNLQKMEYEIPVRIQKGSWEALIPQSLMGWSVAALGAGLTAYATAAGTQIAKNDFKDVSLGELVLRALHKIQAVIRIAKHLDGIGKKIEKFIQQEDGKILIRNERGESLEVTKEELDTYIKSPNEVISKIAGVVSPDRILKVGARKNGMMQEESISAENRSLFVTEETQDDELFPDLKDGEIVTLEGRVTRENEGPNSIGLEYGGHILTCRPEQGSVKRYKQCLFLRCRITGVVKRGEGFESKKPQIHFSVLVPLEEDPEDTQLPLLEM